MKVDCRHFLQVAAASPLVFGLGDLFAQSNEVPAWWKAALDRMRDLGRPGLVFIAPEPKADLDTLGMFLRDLLENDDKQAQEIFCSAVVICLRPEVAKGCLPGNSTPNSLVLLDPPGHVVERDEIPWPALVKPALFEEHVSELVYGKGNARLATSAARVRASLTDAERAAFVDLSAEAVASRERASAVLVKNADRLMPLIVFERRVSDDVQRTARLRQIIEGRFQAADEKNPGPRLPFGTRYQAGWSCGAELEGDISIQCGMAKLEGKGERFLLFLTN